MNLFTPLELMRQMMTGSQSHLPPPAKCSEASTEMGPCLLPCRSLVKLWHVYVWMVVSITGCRVEEILSSHS
jgi:hypothetical protein